MSDYEPTSRRPIANLFRKTANSAVQMCVRANIHPDTISYLSVVASAAAGACFWYSDKVTLFLIVAPLFCYLRLWFNMLDGMVAVAAKKASLRGEILNDLPDRVSDVLVFVGVAHSGWMNPYLGYWGAIFALVVAYVGMFGQAVGVQREFSGVMAKPWRMVGLHIGAWLTWLMVAMSKSTVWGCLTILDWTVLLILLGCLQTLWIRMKRILVALKLKNESEKTT
jgi:phosphatidylglycerophosphate synthase